MPRTLRLLLPLAAAPLLLLGAPSSSASLHPHDHPCDEPVDTLCYTETPRLDCDLYLETETSQACLNL